MSSTPFNPNSQMAFDLFMQERQRHYGTTEGGISRGQMGQGQRYRAPSAGIYQNWGGGEQYAGASRSGHSFSADLSRATAGLRGMATNYMGGMQSRAQQRTQAIQNWQGAYQQASQNVQTQQLRNQYLSGMSPPPPAPNPYGQAYAQGLSRMQSQPARQAANQMATMMSTPAQPNPYGQAYQQAQQNIRNSQLQALGTQMGTTMSTPYTPSEPSLPSANSRAQRRAGQRPPGLR